MAELEQRRYPRVSPPKEQVIAWQSGTRRAVSYMDSVALGGMFILTRQPVALRSMVKVLLDVPLGEIRMRGVVRRIIPQRGMGIEFIAMNQEDRARLNRMLMPLLGK